MACVLLIDDDAELLRQLATAFLARGHRVITALDGRSALASYRAERVDLVITDIIMPVCEGVETILALRAEDSRARIIAMSGGFRVGAGPFLDLARHVGAEEVLAKPFRPSAMVAFAEAVMARPYEIDQAAA